MYVYTLETIYTRDYIYWGSYTYTHIYIHTYWGHICIHIYTWDHICIYIYTYILGSWVIYICLYMGLYIGLVYSLGTRNQTDSKEINSNVKMYFSWLKLCIQWVTNE